MFPWAELLLGSLLSLSLSFPQCYSTYVLVSNPQKNVLWLLVVIALERARKALLRERFRAARSLESKISGSSGNSTDV